MYAVEPSISSIEMLNLVPCTIFTNRKIHSWYDLNPSARVCRPCRSRPSWWSAPPQLQGRLPRDLPRARLLPEIECDLASFLRGLRWVERWMKCVIVSMSVGETVGMPAGRSLARGDRSPLARLSLPRYADRRAGSVLSCRA